MAFDWTLVNSLVQWLVVPILGIIYTLYQQVAKQDKEIIKLLTIFEEREKTRDIYRESQSSDIKDLKNTMLSMQHQLEELTKIISRMQGHADK